jgi:hypothetical protein
MASTGNATAEIGETEHDPVVGGLNLNLLGTGNGELGTVPSNSLCSQFPVPCSRERLPRSLRERHSPRRVHATTEWSVQHQANSTDLVPEMLQHQLAVVRHRAADRSLLADVVNERANRRAISGIATGEHVQRSIVIGVDRRDRSPQLAHPVAQVE